MTETPSDPARDLSQPNPAFTTRLMPSNGARYAKLAVACLIGFVLLVFAAGAIHPAIPGFLLPGFVLLPIGAVVFGKMATKRTAPRTKPRRMARTGVVVGFVVLALVVVISVLLPSLCNPREAANIVKCSSNMKQIGLALRMYADSHQGKLPASLEELYPGADLTPEVFVCPSSKLERSQATTEQEQAHDLRPGSAHLSYVYTGAGLSDPIDDNQVLLYEPVSYHKDGMNVLYGDGHVGYLPAKAAGPLIQKLSTEHRSPATALSGR